MTLYYSKVRNNLVLLFLALPLILLGTGSQADMDGECLLQKQDECLKNCLTRADTDEIQCRLDICPLDKANLDKWKSECKASRNFTSAIERDLSYYKTFAGIDGFSTKDDVLKRFGKPDVTELFEIFRFYELLIYNRFGFSFVIDTEDDKVVIFSYTPDLYFLGDQPPPLGTADHTPGGLTEEEIKATFVGRTGSDVERVFGKSDEKEEDFYGYIVQREEEFWVDLEFYCRKELDYKCDDFTLYYIWQK